VAGEGEGVIVRHIGSHVSGGGKGGAEQEAEFDRKGGVSDTVHQGADAGEVGSGFSGRWLRDDEEDALAGEFVIVIVEVRRAEGIEDACREWRGKKLSSEAEGEIYLGLGLPFAGAALDYGPVELVVMLKGGGEVAEGAESVAGEAVSRQVGALVEEEVFGREYVGGDAGNDGGLESGMDGGGIDVQREPRIGDGPVDFDAGMGWLVVTGEVLVERERGTRGEGRMPDAGYRRGNRRDALFDGRRRDACATSPCRRRQGCLRYFTGWKRCATTGGVAEGEEEGVGEFELMLRDEEVNVGHATQADVGIDEGGEMGAFEDGDLDADGLEGGEDLGKVVVEEGVAGGILEEGLAKG